MYHRDSEFYLRAVDHRSVVMALTVSENRVILVTK